MVLYQFPVLGIHMKKRSQPMSCYQWITLLIHPYHRLLAQIPPVSHIMRFIFSMDLGPALVHSAKARIIGKGTSLTMQSLSPVHYRRMEPTVFHNAAIHLTGQSIHNLWGWANPWVWTERKLSWQNSRRQDKINYCFCFTGQTAYILYPHTDVINQTCAYVMSHVIALLHLLTE